MGGRILAESSVERRAHDRRAGSARIVAMGGSSTGGAWQNDKLDQFWPAELERSVGGAVQVVNLGVGGWTTSGEIQTCCTGFSSTSC